MMKNIRPEALTDNPFKMIGKGCGHRAWASGNGKDDDLGRSH